jgi:uncharacterized protein (DUF983 family)
MIIFAFILWILYHLNAPEWIAILAWICLAFKVLGFVLDVLKGIIEN